MDHSAHTRLATTELTQTILTGATIYGADDHKVGKVSHIHGSGAAAHVVIDVGGFWALAPSPLRSASASLNSCETAMARCMR